MKAGTWVLVYVLQILGSYNNGGEEVGFSFNGHKYLSQDCMQNRPNNTSTECRESTAMPSDEGLRLPALHLHQDTATLSVCKMSFLCHFLVDSPFARLHSSCLARFFHQRYLFNQLH